MRLLVVLGVVCAALSAAPAATAVTPVRWCGGGDLAATDRLRDRVGGPQIHVIYAIPSDGDDRFVSLASLLATDVAAIDEWWRRNDPARAPRFDLFDFPGCESRFGLLDLSHVRLPFPAGAFAETGRFDRIRRVLAAPQFGFANRNKKYLVFYDGAVVPDDICGTASGDPGSGGANEYAIVYLRSSCPTTVGLGRGNAYVAAHELLHLLGAVPLGAPHGCRDGHVCDSSADLLWAEYASDALDHAVLDVGRDDYYGHLGPWFDLQDSRWVGSAAPLALTLRLVGAGVVASEPDGQSCEAICVTEWDSGTRVQLVAEARPGFRFTGWSGACAGQSGPVCVLEVAAPDQAVATFRRTAPLALSVTGRGTVTGGGVRCARSCSSVRLDGEAVALRAQPRRGWRFVRWTGRCRGTARVCRVRVAGATRVGAVFRRA